MRAWNLMLKAAAAIRPTHVVCMGDMADCLQVSSHRKDPEMCMALEEELASARVLLAQVNDLCAPGRKIFLEGNHERRLRNYIIDKAPALHGFVGIDAQLGLSKSGWEFHEYGEVAHLGKLHLTHDVGSCGQYAHEISRAKMGGSTVIGHTHRSAIAYSGTLAGHRHVAAMFGWLGDKNFAKYIARPLREHWQLGFGVGWMERDTGVVHLQCVPIVDYRCVVNGVLFVG